MQRSIKNCIVDGFLRSQQISISSHIAHVNQSQVGHMLARAVRLNFILWSGRTGQKMDVAGEGGGPFKESVRSCAKDRGLIVRMSL